MTPPSMRILTIAVLGAALVASPAFAQEPQPAAPGSSVRTEALVPIQKDWTKVCGTTANKQVCYTTRDFGAEAGKPAVLALAVYDIEGDDAKIVRMMIPVGVTLSAGIRYVVDNGPTIEGSYENCFPKGCFAKSKVTTALVATMKTASTMSVSVRNQDKAEVIFAVPLAGFGKSYDGPAIDPKVLQDKQKAQAELQKRAEDEGNRLEASKASGGSSSTDGATAAGSTFVYVIFQDDISKADKDEFLQAYSVSIVDGPNPNQSYRLRLGEQLAQDQLQLVLNSMNSQTRVVKLAFAK